jgi:hypothetical protein
MEEHEKLEKEVREAYNKRDMQKEDVDRHTLKFKTNKDLKHLNKEREDNQMIGIDE